MILSNPLATITDAKSLHDNLMREQYTGAEKRVALEMCVTRECLESLASKPDGFHMIAIRRIGRQSFEGTWNRCCSWCAEAVISWLVEK